MVCCNRLHLLQAIVSLALGLNTNNQFGKFRLLPISTQFQNWSGGKPHSEVHIIGSVRFAALTSGFAWMSAFTHLVVLLKFELYISDLRMGINRFRWLEYACSSSLMLVLIAMLFGMYDIISLVLLAVCNASMNLFGYMMELQNQTTNKTDWTAFVFGCFAGFAPWGCIFAYIAGIPDQSAIPSFVWAILATYLIGFNTFALNMLLQYLEVGWFSDLYHGYHIGGYYFGRWAACHASASRSPCLSFATVQVRSRTRCRALWQRLSFFGWFWVA